MLLGREYHIRFQNSRFYYAMLLVTAAFLMISCLIPFEIVLVPAVATKPKDWRKICAVSVLGSALGAASLSAFFQFLGLPFLENLFPNFASSKGWAVTSGWLETYGPWAMAGVAALPIAQGPAIAVAGLFRIPYYSIFAAFLVGKTVKFSIISLLVARGERMKEALTFPKIGR